MTITINGSTGIAFPDGTSDAGRLLSVRTFTIANTGQTYTPTPGTKSIIVEAVGGGGGSSPLGVGGVTGFGTTAGSNASGYGSGGGAAGLNTGGQPGGNGTPGAIIVWEYA